MSQRKTERLVNLVLALLSTRRFLTAEQIREAVPGYEADSDEAFKRMFERDKNELRELGVPIETGSDSAWDDEQGYRIGQRDYALPEVHLEPDEAAALALAAQLWQTGLAQAASTALVKLQALGIELEAGAVHGLEPRVDAGDPALAPCLAAVRSGTALTFGYRRSGAAVAESRTVEPWGVVSWRGPWYLTGYDRAREATRVFRLSRMTTVPVLTGAAGSVTVPAGVDLRALVVDAESDGPPVSATVALRPGTGLELRRRGETATGAGPLLDGAPSDLVTVSTTMLERLAEDVCALGADALAESPPELRAAVVRRLTRVSGMPA